MGSPPLISLLSVKPDALVISVARRASSHIRPSAAVINSSMSHRLVDTPSPRLTSLKGGRLVSLSSNALTL